MRPKDDEDRLLRSVALQNAQSILIARQRAEQRSEFYLAEGQRLAHMGSWAFSPSGVFDYWSPELFRICGLDPAQGAPALDEYLASIHPRDRQLMAGAMEKMLADGSGCDVTPRIVRPDGELRHVRWVGAPVVEEGVFKGVVGTALDVTEHEHLTQELRRRELYLAEAQRLSHTGSFSWRLPTGEMHWSEETFRIFQYDRTTTPRLELVLQRVHPDDLALVKQHIEQMSRGRTDYDLAYRLLMPEASVKHIHVVAQAMSDESGNIECVGAVMDVTAAKELEDKIRQAQADLAHVSRVTTLGEMAASIAHEVDQPLSGVVINANACLRFLSGASPNLDEVRDGLRAIARDGRRASDVIARIRALARGRTTEKEPLDIDELVRDVVDLAEGEVRRARARLRTELAGNLPRVLGDRVQLQQVVLNLLLNGLDAMQSVVGRPRALVVSTRKEAIDRIHVTVQDSGCGIDPKLADRIFEAFYTTKPGGMGMGLSISRSIVEHHGGRLWAAPNDDGPGTTVHFTV